MSHQVALRLRDTGIKGPQVCIVRRPAGTVEGILRHSAAKFKLFRSHAVLLHMYTAMYGGRMLNAAPEPVLPIVMACVCAPAAAIATE